MVANEYAKALFELARENKKVDVFLDNFDQLIKAIELNKDYMKVLTYPHISDSDKKESLKQVLVGFDEKFIHFLFVVLDHHRFNTIKEIANAYKNLVLENRKIVEVTVYTPQELNDEEYQLLKHNITNLFNGKDINMDIRIDESLIGGVKIYANGKILDMTIISKLNHLRTTI